MKKVSCKEVVIHPACVTCAGICVDQHVLNLTSKWVFYIYKIISGLLEMSSLAEFSPDGYEVLASVSSTEQTRQGDTPVTPALRSYRQDGQQFKASFGFSSEFWSV